MDHYSVEQNFLLIPTVIGCYTWEIVSGNSKLSFYPDDQYVSDYTYVIILTAGTKTSEGDSLAFDEVYRQYYNKTYSFAYRYLQNKQDAEEVVQEVFIAVWNRRDKLKEIKNLKECTPFLPLPTGYRTCQVDPRHIRLHRLLIVLWCMVIPNQIHPGSLAQAHIA